MAERMTLAEKQSLAPSMYIMDRVPYALEEHVDPSFGLLADAFGHPRPDMIATEDMLMSRTTVLSKSGRVPSRVQEEEIKAKLAETKPLPRAQGDAGLPTTEYLHRGRKACTPVYTITNERINDPSILLRDPKTATTHLQFYARPADAGRDMRDAFKTCERGGAVPELASAFS